MRKNLDLNILDNIKIEYTSDGEVVKAIESGAEFIKSETLAVEVTKNDSVDGEEVDLNSHMSKIKIQKFKNKSLELLA